jgi:hypothetical protein
MAIYKRDHLCIGEDIEILERRENLLHGWQMEYKEGGGQNG